MDELKLNWKKTTFGPNGYFRKTHMYLANCMDFWLILPYLPGCNLAAYKWQNISWKNRFVGQKGGMAYMFLKKICNLKFCSHLMFRKHYRLNSSTLWKINKQKEFRKSNLMISDVQDHIKCNNSAVVYSTWYITIVIKLCVMLG